MISMNPGEPLKPLAEVASGGELSRIMLAIKTVMADKDEIPTLIFDEIDVGISGRTAQKYPRRWLSSEEPIRSFASPIWLRSPPRRMPTI